MDAAARITELEEEVAYLRSELGLVRDLAQIGRLVTRLRIGKTQANFLLALYNSRANPLNRYRLYDITRMHGLREEVDIKIVDIQVCKLRRQLGHDVIETVRGLGYRLTPLGVATVEMALA